MHSTGRQESKTPHVNFTRQLCAHNPLIDVHCSTFFRHDINNRRAYTGSSVSGRTCKCNGIRGSNRGIPQRWFHHSQHTSYVQRMDFNRPRASGHRRTSSSQSWDVPFESSSIRALNIEVSGWKLGGVEIGRWFCRLPTFGIGVLACLDGYMNIAMEQTEEFVDGQLKAKYGDCFIRGNNGTFLTWIRGHSVRPLIERDGFGLTQFSISVLYISTTKKS